MWTKHWYVSQIIFFCVTQKTETSEDSILCSGEEFTLSQIEEQLNCAKWLMLELIH